MKGGTRSRSNGRIVAASAAMSLVAVVALGAVLSVSYRDEARSRGVAVGREQAALLAESAVEPFLVPGHPLASGLTPDQRSRLQQEVAHAKFEHMVLRLRLRDLAGNVVYTDDGSGLHDKPEDEVLEAAHGAVVADLTRVNSDANDVGPAGVAAVEVYMPLDAGTTHTPVGVLEVYLPYHPINQDITAGLHRMYFDLAIGLAALCLALFLIGIWVTKGLRRQVALNGFLAEHDALTGLPNRELFLERAKAAVARARSYKPCAIAIFDLNRFKEVNDTLGHHNGDLLLLELARRLQAAVGPGDTVARLGGDEFGVVLSGVDNPAVVLANLRTVIDREVEVCGLPLSVEASVGYVVAPNDGTDAAELMQRADVAMYVAKAQYGGVSRYDATRDHYDAANLGLIAELRHAIEDDQLVLHFQPKAALADGRIEAVETLVRWEHPVHGLLYPDAFLPYAEQTDLIDRLTEWVLEHALAEVRNLGLIELGLSVAVNVSARNLAHAEFADVVVGVLRRTRVPAERLIIEITETALLADPTRAAIVLTELSRAGVKISLDDFGQGQTSLGYLSELPVHELKIDKSFVGDMVVDPTHAAIVRSIVDLGHNLALRVVGEGVETDDVRALLRETGCDVAQGYFYARPMPAERLRAWLAHEMQANAPAPESTAIVA
jgi:diguanylate cyclase (GGDEF)-like protein